MKKLSILKNKGTKLTKSSLKSIGGGYSWLYCATHSFNVQIGDVTIIEAPVGGEGNTMTWAECRAAKD
ncbi:hypothetical protein ACM40_09200 [Chryseobacterium sp. BLS98]|jgi:hypothetical protein|uniref:hypothetical protein n=1 Tax=Chryseobacterium sp. BLS98 TaxID=885586 RepID=UPI00065A9801|nr:hypothetical protein [Chryseobacterium sp. BLS98]KMQ62453.1 hypothetical protein ACM40_09200 [Chryseobacterium sp. BLS98]